MVAKMHSRSGSNGAASAVSGGSDASAPPAATNEEGDAPRAIAGGSAGDRWSQGRATEGILRLRALTVRAARTFSQSGSAVRRTSSLWASHSASQDEQVRRYEPPEYAPTSRGVPS